MPYHSNNTNAENIHRLFTQLNPYLRVLGHQRKQKIKGLSLNVTTCDLRRHRLHGFLCTFKQQIRGTRSSFIRLGSARRAAGNTRLESLLSHGNLRQPHLKQLGVTFFLPEARRQSKGKISPKRRIRGQSFEKLYFIVRFSSNFTGKNKTSQIIFLKSLQN